MKMSLWRERLGYRSGQSATTLLSLQGARFTIAPRNGTYPGAPSMRAYRIVWSNVAAPAGVIANGVVIGQDASALDLWSYDATGRTLVIALSERPVNAPLVIELQ
jgi:hypothetical protein